MIVIVLRGEPEGRKQPPARVAYTKAKKPYVAFYSAKETAAYQKALALTAKVAMAGRPLLKGPLRVNVLAVMGVPSSWNRKARDMALVGVIRPTGKPDWDNIGKQLDAFKGVVWDDDASIVDGRVVKRYGEEPMFRVEVEVIHEGPLL